MTENASSPRSTNPRFAVLRHDHPFLHWDFLLEQGESCRTWRLMKAPDTPDDIPAEAIADHRLMYLDYEGPVSGDRGTVTQWDAGTFEWLTNGDDLVEVRLTGQTLSGVARLQRDDSCWTLRLATAVSSVSPL